jgi:hypothetical protein
LRSGSSSITRRRKTGAPTAAADAGSPGRIGDGGRYCAIT